VKIAVTGASGLVGSALVPALEGAGHEIVRLVRRAPSGPDELAWDPAAGTIDAAGLEGVDVAVHLAGETIGQRWTSSARERILSSRVDGTALIARTLADLEPRPSALVHASAVGLYPTGDATLTEESPSGTGFHSDVVVAWEHAAEPAREAGIRTVALRQAPIVARDGGFVARMLLPFRLGLGGRIGSGRQWWSWVALADVVRAYLFVLDSDVSGALNVAAPGVVTSAEFVDALGHALHRPTVLPLPAFAVRAAFGEMGEEMLLGSRRAVPERLTQAGFSFAHPELEPFLRSLFSA
jgi:uncharacterized protein (TIGR01777 family)